MPDEPSFPLLIVAGEASGDERAAEVLGHLRTLKPGITAFGMGGERLRAQGCDVLVDIRDASVFGIVEAFSAARRMRGYMDHLLDVWDVRSPAAALLVDFGGFNLRLARKLKERGARIIYYISPQVWASRPKRALQIRELVDLLLVVFPFEVDFYRRVSVDAHFVGHPLLDTVRTTRNREDVLRDLGLDPARTTVCLMPGSRASEIKRLLPLMLASVTQLKVRGIDQFVLIAAPGVKDLIHASDPAGQGIRVIENDKYNIIAASDLVLLASGTAALEVALLGTPAVVVYKTSALTGFLAKFIVTVPWVSLPNIILNEEVYPELLQGGCTAEAMTRVALDILEDAGRCDRIRGKLSDLARRLGTPGAAGRAAAAIAGFLEQG